MPDKEDKLFVIKPIPTVNVKPVIIFINPKSGGNQGVKLLQKFQWHLNPRQVFDLSRGGPRMGLELYKKVPNLRVLACGGDGTVGWVLSILDQIANAVSFPVGVLPLGTGNDLARALGWGGGYMDEPVSKILTNLEESETIRLDRWNLEVVPNEQVKGTDHAGKDNLPLNVMNNYFSLGVDAQIALEFHEAREANPEKFSSRMYNKLFYGVRGGIELLDRKWKGLSDHVTLECDGKDLTQRIKDLKVHAILFLNIPSYGGGTRPWNKSAGNNSTDDGLIEVIGLTIMQITRLQTGGTGTPLCQCKTARITTGIPVPMQVDGEACRLKPSVITLGFFNQATMMAKRRKGRQTPTRETTIDKHKVSVQRLKLQDYEQHHCDKELLIQSSINMGEIEVEPVADLETVRKLVEKLELNGSPSIDHAGNTMPKLSPDWCFVDCCTAERFFRIDRAQESLHYLIDITHDQLFVLDDPHRPPSTEEDVTVVLKSKEPIDDQGAQDTTTSMRVKSEISRLESIKTHSSVKCPQDEGHTNGTNHSTRTSEVYNRLFDLQSNEDHHYGQVRTSDKIIEAAKTGNLNMLRNLFEMGYSLMSINKDGQTALHVASQRGDSNLVRYILANAPSNIVSIKDNQEKRDELKINKKNIKSFTTVDKVYLKCSFIAALHIVKTKKPYNIGEKLIKPCMVDICSELFGNEHVSKIKNIPMSNDTIHKRILCIANDIEYQLVEKINKSLFYAIQLDESTDISNSAILLIYVRYIDDTFNDIKEEFLCTLKLKTFTTADEIFKTMNNYMISKNINWASCIGICTDGAASMTGIHSGVVSRVKEVAHAHLISTHCFIHREQLAVKDMGENFNDILNQCIRWLLREKVLTRFFELRTEIEVFLREKNSPLSDHFQDIIWLAKVAYLSDIFSLLNELNLSMQGPLTNIFSCYNKVEAFLKKLDLWIKRIQENIYFPPSHNIRLSNMWILNPFLPCEKHEFSLLNESQLLELSSDKLLEQSFNTKSLNQFWISLSKEYPNLYEEALKKNKLDVESTMRISLTNSIEAQIDSLVKQHQDQGSH
ncbi:hypothetical protein AGLY_005345 [Aphis glycines]|uniref:Diacylglycerol kinase n=1 Tax=Aphis glycines TaxID=307491 RepID=A0A6G0TYW8_APHGL|nr:hypothetical protein AGLY_005345 [Aphis glycines]